MKTLHLVLLLVLTLVGARAQSAYDTLVYAQDSTNTLNYYWRHNNFSTWAVVTVDPSTHQEFTVETINFLATTSQAGFMSASDKSKLNSLNPTTPSVPHNGVSHTLNSSFTPPSSGLVRCTYSINASWTLNALLSGSATAFLEYSVNGGSTWITVSQVSKNLQVLSFAGGDDMSLTGDVAAGATNMRIRTTSTNMTVTYVLGQETW